MKRNKEIVISFYSTAFFLLFLILSSCKAHKEYQEPSAKNTHGIIPLPTSVDFQEGFFTLNRNVVFSGSDSFPSAAKIVTAALNLALTGGNSSKSNAAGPEIRFVSDTGIPGEGYKLVISAKGITISAGKAAGAFYASQSLRQMIWNLTLCQKQESIKLPLVSITDAPKYGWRGFHIDVARHFFTKEYIMKTIDWLALYKFNKLQIHLTDDQGWRIQIDQFPLLTEKGAWRTFNNYDSACMKKSESDSRYQIDSHFIKVVDGKTVYGGYYTKQDINEIVKYASDNFIEVIPEIDMPGHMSAAISAYPFLSCTGTAGWGTEFSYPICPCNEESMKFCYKVWDEVAALFPSSLVHIGCDEVEKGTWEASSDCQKYMIANNLSGVNAIQNNFVVLLQKYLENKGKKVIAWDDVIDGNVDKDLVLMYWRDWVGDSPVRGAKNGNSLIFTPWTLFYLSGDNSDAALKNQYEYDASSIFNSQVMTKITGFQGCVWTEDIPSEAVFEYMVYPRLQALSETEWSKGKDWSSFRMRLKTHLQYMTAMHIGYREPNLNL